MEKVTDIERCGCQVRVTGFGARTMFVEAILLLPHQHLAKLKLAKNRSSMSLYARSETTWRRRRCCCRGCWRKRAGFDGGLLVVFISCWRRSLWSFFKSRRKVDLVRDGCRQKWRRSGGFSGGPIIGLWVVAEMSDADGRRCLFRGRQRRRKCEER